MRLFMSALLIAVAATGCAAEPDPGTIDPDPPGGIEPPFLVSKYFAPSGYMGDGTGETNLVGETEGCAPRPDGAEGDCYKFTYTPAAQLWAGVYWQYPPNNWGSLEGKKIAPGATKVSFWAAGGAGGEPLTVTIGGIHDVTLPHSDTLKAQQMFTLTKTMTEYTIDLSAQTYETVIGGFSWSTNYPEGTNPSTAAPTIIYLDGIVWE